MTETAILRQIQIAEDFRPNRRRERGFGGEIHLTHGQRSKLRHGGDLDDPLRREGAAVGQIQFRQRSTIVRQFGETRVFKFEATFEIDGDEPIVGQVEEIARDASAAANVETFEEAAVF